MFKRRNPLTLLQKAKQFIWPSMGWVRMAKYLKRRLLRLPDSSAKVAGGLAIGAAISFSPLVGTHIVQAALLASLFRYNIIAAAIGTIFGSPWTFPLIWYASIEFGARIFDILGLPAETNIPDHVTVHMMWDLVREQPMRIFLPWMTGGYLLALFSYPVFYTAGAIFMQAARRAHIRKRKKLREKRIKARAEHLEKMAQDINKNAGSS